MATTPQDATTMKPPQTPAHAYLPPEHQAILRTLARWLGDDAGNLGQDSDQPSQTKQEEIGK